MSRIPRLLLPCLVLVLAALGAAAAPARLSPPGPVSAWLDGRCSAPIAGGDARVVVRTGSAYRTVLIHVPPRPPRSAPLVVALHGAGGSGPFMEGYSGLSKVADRAGFVVAYPSSPNRRSGRWDLTGPGDVAFVAALIDRLETSPCIDRTRVSAVGVSNGGGMTARLGCELSGRLAGIVVVAGGFAGLPPCAPDRPVSVLELHGTDDRVVPYAGRPDDDFAGNVRAWVRAWAQRDGCPARVRRARAAPGALRYDWAPCAQGTAVGQIVLQGGEHAWPGATPPDPGPPTRISAASEAWRFLAPRRLSAPQSMPA